MFYRHPVKVMILEKRSNGWIWDMDSARKIISVDGKERYILKRRQQKFSPPPFKDIHLTAGGKNLLPLMHAERGIFLPIEIDNPKGIKIMDKGAHEWIINELISSQQRFPKSIGFFEKYSGYILLALTGVMMMFIVIFLTQSLEHIAGTTASGAGALADAIKQITPLIQQAAAKAPASVPLP